MLEFRGGYDSTVNQPNRAEFSVGTGTLCRPRGLDRMPAPEVEGAVQQHFSMPKVETDF